MQNEPRYLTAWYTDRGIQKETNQDSALLLQADTPQGPVLLAALCDGMGGLEKGELASATAVRAFDRWFRQDLPVLLQQQDFAAALSESWTRLVNDLNHKLGSYGKLIHTNLGTTVVAVLLVGQTYYILNVGDSRVYLLADQLYQLTHDQTFVQQQIDQGLMNEQQAEYDPRRSVLLQCVGASPSVVPDFFAGAFQPGQRLLLCSDGFRHVISPNEIFAALSGYAAPGRADMAAGLHKLVELNKARLETDNITALLIHV